MAASTLPPTVAPPLRAPILPSSGSRADRLRCPFPPPSPRAIADAPRLGVPHADQPNVSLATALIPQSLKLSHHPSPSPPFIAFKHFTFPGPWQCLTCKGLDAGTARRRHPQLGTQRGGIQGPWGFLCYPFLLQSRSIQQGSQLMNEVEERETILKQCMEQLVSVEATRAALISNLKEAIQEQESKMELIRTQLQVWGGGEDLLQLIQETREHSKTVTNLVISQSGDKLYSGSVDKSVRIWSVRDGEIQCTKVHDMKDQVHNLAVANKIACFVPQGTGVKGPSYLTLTNMLDV